VLELFAAEAIGRESREYLAVPFARTFDAPQNEPLILFIGDSKAWLQTNLLTEFTEQLGTK
jgi:hypothetical protein